MKTRILMLAAIASSGCVGLFLKKSTPDTEFAGVYALDSWTENTEGCDAEGEQVLRPEGALVGVAADNNVLIGGFVFAFVCADLDNCAELQDDGFLVGLVENGWRLDDGSDADGWNGIFDTSLETGDGMCESYRETATLTGSGDSIRIEIRTEVLEPYAQLEGEDPCPRDEIEARAQGTCSFLEVVEGTYQEEMPPVPEE